MARSRRTTPSAQSSVPASTAPAGARRARTTPGPEPAPAATQPAPAAKTRRSTRARSVESNVSAASRVSKTRRRLDAPREVQEVDLTNIPEADSDDDDYKVNLELSPPDEVRSQPNEEQDEDGPAGDRSLHSMSGTTALDHHSLQGESQVEEELNPHALLAYTPRAYDAATKLINRFEASKPQLHRLLKFINQPGSENHVGFQQHVENLTQALLALGESFPTTVHNADAIMDELFKQSFPHGMSGCWRLTEVVHLLNLAVTVQAVASSPAEEMMGQLATLDTQFPHPYLKDLNMTNESPTIVGNSFLMDETFEVALAIRIQCAVLRIRQDSTKEEYDANQIIQELFFMVDTQDTLRAWDQNGIGGGELGLLPEYNERMREEIEHLVREIRDDERDVADGEAEKVELERFSWSKFQATFLRWAKLRMQEITESVGSSGGIKKLMQEIKTELAKDPTFDPNAAVPPPPSPAKRRTVSGASQSQSQQFSATVPPPSPLQSRHGNSQGPRSQPPYDHFQDVDDIEVAQDKNLDPQLVNILNMQKEKERQQKENLGRQPNTAASPTARRPRAFIDPQDDAEQITTFDTQASQTQRPGPSGSRNAAGKRPAPARADDVSDDEGFTQDTREVPMSARRRSAFRPAIPSPNKRVRLVEPIRSPSGSAPLREPTRGVPGSVHEAGPQTASQDARVQEYAEQKQIMATQTAPAMRAPSNRARYPQGRERWTVEAEFWLEKLICEHGWSPAFIKGIDAEGENLFEGRDQVAIKDKARNMKITMLKTGVYPLPRNWVNVPVDRKGLDACRKAGVSEERLREAGVKL